MRAVNRLAKMLPSSARFCIVGLAASLTHGGVFVLLVHAGLTGLTANFVSYSIALMVSYFGHSTWTFNAKGPITKFVTTSLLGLGLNSLISSVVVDHMHISAWIAAAAMVTITPIMTFFVLKAWVFNETT